MLQAHLVHQRPAGPVHRLAPQCKIAAQLAFVLAVVSTPREAFWAFGLFATLIAIVARYARVPARFVLKRLTIEVPFVAFAVFLPFVGGGPRSTVLGVALSVEGMWAAWNILAKATLGLSATLVVAGTTSVPEMLVGLERLRLPPPLVAIASFMVRYAEVVAGEMRRMSVARRSRGHDPRWLWQARAVASSAGTLFVRSYERGERVWLAMRSRGYEGASPMAGHDAATSGEWAAALTLPGAAVLIAGLAWNLM